MAKSEYRKQDVLLESIHARYKEKFPVTPACFKTNKANWNIVCDELTKEFEEQGLQSSADYIQKWKVK